MIDTHSHIYEPEFDEDREEVILRAQEQGIERILLPNINQESIEPMLKLCQQHPDYLYPMIGLHPEDVKEDYEVVLQQMERLLQQPNHPYIAVGEVGLDFYWDTSYKEQQIMALHQQIKWAIKYHLPLMIHTRSAHKELMEVFKEYASYPLTGVFHCFGGTSEEAAELLSHPGFVLGIGGVVTFKKSTLPEVLQHVPLDRIVLETDCPYLAPVPHRGKRNESAFLVDVARQVSNIYNVSISEVESVTNATVKRLFPRTK